VNCNVKIPVGEVISLIVSSLKTEACFSVNLHLKITLSTTCLHKANYTYLSIAYATMVSKQANDRTSDHTMVIQEMSQLTQDDQVDNVRVTLHASRVTPQTRDRWLIVRV